MWNTVGWGYILRPPPRAEPEEQGRSKGEVHIFNIYNRFQNVSGRSVENPRTSSLHKTRAYDGWTDGQTPDGQPPELRHFTYTNPLTIVRLAIKNVFLHCVKCHWIHICTTGRTISGIRQGLTEIRSCRTRATNSKKLFARPKSKSLGISITKLMPQSSYGLIRIYLSSNVSTTAARWYSINDCILTESERQMRERKL